MPPATYPEKPDFADPSEEMAWESLRRHLRDEDTVLHGVRFSDPHDGDVEVDLLVLFPDLGAVVIEVKGGHVSFAEGTFWQTGATGRHEIDPVNQAMRGMRALKRYLEGQPTWSRGALRVAWLACFPYTEVNGDMGPQGRRHVLVGASDVDDLAGRAYDRLTDPAIHAPYPPDHWVDAALQLLHGAQDNPAEIAARSADRLRHADQLSSAQSMLLRAISPNPRYELSGSAGTGKTWLAMEQARRWAQDGERVAFVTYGRGVAESVRRALADAAPRHQPAFVGTFHQLGWTWGVDAPEGAGPEYWEVEAPQRMLAAAQLLPTEERFTAFVVDEAQDFADSWWPALLSSARDGQFRLAVMRDDEQAVFHERRGRPDLPLVPLVLDENLRNSIQVVDSFRPLINRDVITRGRRGDPIEYVACASGEAIAAADAVVEELLENRGWLPEHIALLTTQHRHPVQVESAGDKAAYWEDFWRNDVFYSTVAGFKGLERPVVVLAVDGFHEGISPASVMYAGMSRARDLLIVVGEEALLAEAVGDKLMRRLQRQRAQGIG